MPKSKKISSDALDRIEEMLDDQVDRLERRSLAGELDDIDISKLQTIANILIKLSERKLKKSKKKPRGSSLSTEDLTKYA